VFIDVVAAVIKRCPVAWSRLYRPTSGLGTIAKRKTFYCNDTCSFIN